MKLPTHCSAIEGLEPRIAPAAFADSGADPGALEPDLRITNDGKTAVFTDVDGDKVRVRTTSGTWTAAHFELEPTQNFLGGSVLKTLRVTNDFAGADITISAEQGLLGGDAAVNFETLDGSGVDLRKVTIAGAIGEVLAGSGMGLAIKKLSVDSLGKLGLVTQEQRDTFPASRISGHLGKVIVATDVRYTEIAVTGAVKSVTVGGSWLQSNLGAGASLGPLTIAGDIVGWGIGSPAVFYAFGQETQPSGTKPDFALQALTVGGNVEFASFWLGYRRDGSGGNADASVGPVKVGGNWIASSLLAGTTAGDDGLIGTADDVKISGDGVRDRANTYAQIASIKIRGQTFGTAVNSDSYAIIAEQINKAKIGRVKLLFVAGPNTPTDFYYMAPTGPGASGEVSDLTIGEVRQLTT